MPINTIDTVGLAENVGNIYEAVVILSKRARQVSMRTKSELDQKLSYYDDLGMDPAEEMRLNEDQYRLSVDYEKRPKAPQVAIDEIENGEIYYRNPSAED